MDRPIRHQPPDRPARLWSASFGARPIGDRPARLWSASFGARPIGDRPARLSLSDRSGFSLIEVLVVMAIIGILAAIAIPMFLGQSDKAKDASAKSDLKTVVRMVEECKLEQETYENCDQAVDLNGAPGINWGVAEGNAGMVADGENGYFAYAVSAAKRSDGQNHIYIWEKTAGGSTRKWCFSDNPPSHSGCRIIR